MRDGWYIDVEGNQQSQEMFRFEPDPTPRGLKEMLQERGMYEETWI